MNPLNCEAHLENALGQGQKLFAEDSICFTMDEDGGLLQFGLEEDGHPIFYKISKDSSSPEIIWEDETVMGKYMTVDQDALLLINKDGEVAWQAGGCLSPPFELDAEDHELRLEEDGVRLLEPKTDTVLWTMDTEGQVEEFCPEHKLEEGQIAGVVVGSFFAFCLTLVILVAAYRRNRGDMKTAPVMIETQPEESAQEGDKKDKAGNV